MLSSKRNILQTVALLKSYGVKEIVLSPGSRNAPIIQTFSQEPFFNCHIILDERNASFHAIGIIQKTQNPVAICCTSGSALLNYAPAVSEAFYQHLPLIIISADRSPEWIGQMDGQTLPQPNIFGELVKKSVNIPEIKNETDEWYCNRLINEALNSSISSFNAGPVHINIPLSEPLFDYSVTELPSVRKINKPILRKEIISDSYKKEWTQLPNKIIVVGQMFYSEKLISILNKFADRHNCVILSEHLSNCTSSKFISNFDTLLGSICEEDRNAFRPDLLITFGGHIVSKRLKHFFRQYKPDNHWLIDESGETIDLFQSLTDIIEANPIDFLTDIEKGIETKNHNEFYNRWKDTSQEIKEPSDKIIFSDIWATRSFIKRLPKKSPLHLANSNAVRNAQLFDIDKSVRVYCNRGINGIESTLPSTIGFASVSIEPIYLIIGDLSFFYGVGSLWNIKHINNLRILLINNSGGGIFHLLPGLNKSESLSDLVAAGHSESAESWSNAAGFKYLTANNKDSFEKQIEEFVTSETTQSIIFEIKVDIDESKKVLHQYYDHIRQEMSKIKSNNIK